MDAAASDKKLYQSLDDAAGQIIFMISQLIQVNTLFVASNDKVSNTILKVFNRQEELLREGTVLPFEQTYCNIVIENKTETLIIEDTSSHPLTSGMSVTQALGSCSFIGVPIWRRDGEVFGTICALDRNSYAYSEQDVSLLNSMATFLSYVIELEHSITVLQETEQQLIQAKDAAEQAARAKTEFLALMSHEIRTPMNGIMGMTSLLQETDQTEEQREYTDSIRGSNESLLSILNDILDFSKIESGKMTLEHQPYDLKSCVEDVLDLFASKTIQKDIELISYIDPQIPPILVGDVSRIRQVLVNLIGNAVKFTSDGEIVVSVHRMPSESSGSMSLYISVKDTGIGIPADRMDRLFQSFSQAHAPEVIRQYGGTGLGLAICKQLVELMGGRIGVESIADEGTKFHFTLEAELADIFWDKDAKWAHLRQKRLLIVDDNSTNLRILKLLAEKWGMHAKATVSAREALHWIEQGDIFDVAVIDMVMPEMDGVQLGHKIRKHRTPESLPMVMLTSMGTDASSIDSKACFASVISKPVREQQLMDVLLSALYESHIAPSRQRKSSLLDPSLAQRVPLRILVAEDNAVNQKLLLRILEKMGYAADLAGNGLEAVQIVDKRHYDLIFMDVQMPVMDGLEATRAIHHKLAQSKRPAIIAVTANARQEDKELCLAAGMDDYISKPLRLEEVQRLLTYWGEEIRHQSPAVPPAASEVDQFLDASIIEEIRSLNESTEFQSELYLLFSSEAADCIHQIQAFWTQKDFQGMDSSVHMLKGVSLNVGATRLARLCSQLEEKLRQAQEIDAVIEELPQVFEQTKYYLDRLADSMPKGI